MTGMKARYEVGEIDHHNMTVEITMSVSDWKTLRRGLDDVDSPSGSILDQFHSLIDRTLAQFQEATACRWISTPYRSEAED